MNVVPFPSSLSKVIVPPRASVNRLTTASPKPWPLDLVVNRGENSLGFASSGMPTPVSDTAIAVLSASWYAWMASFPPLGMAWIALLTRLAMIRFSTSWSVVIFLACFSIWQEALMLFGITFLKSVFSRRVSKFSSSVVGLMGFA